MTSQKLNLYGNVKNSLKEAEMAAFTQIRTNPYGIDNLRAANAIIRATTAILRAAKRIES